MNKISSNRLILNSGILTTTGDNLYLNGKLVNGLLGNNITGRIISGKIIKADFFTSGSYEVINFSQEEPPNSILSGDLFYDGNFDGNKFSGKDFEGETFKASQYFSGINFNSQNFSGNNFESNSIEGDIIRSSTLSGEKISVENFNVKTFNADIFTGIYNENFKANAYGDVFSGRFLVGKYYEYPISSSRKVINPTVLTQNFNFSFDIENVSDVVGVFRLSNEGEQSEFIAEEVGEPLVTYYFEKLYNKAPNIVFYNNENGNNNDRNFNNIYIKTYINRFEVWNTRKSTTNMVFNYIIIE